MKPFFRLWMGLGIAWYLLGSPQLGAENLLSNPSFEAGLSGWEGFWSREPRSGTVEPISSPVKAGRVAAKVVHRGTKDWSFSSSLWAAVRPGEVYAFSGWVRGGGGPLQLSVVLRDSSRVVDWMYALKQVSRADEWTRVEGRFVVPAGGRTIQFRFTGEGASTWFLDEVALFRVKEAPAAVVLGDPVRASSSHITVVLDSSQKRLKVSTAHSEFEFDAEELLNWLVAVDQPSKNQLVLSVVDPWGPTPIRVGLDVGESFLTLTLSGSGGFEGSYGALGPLLSKPGQSWVLPVNEGLQLPVDWVSTSPELQNQDWVLYGGHGLSMPFVALTDGQTGLLALAETPDDGFVRFLGAQGPNTSRVHFFWQPSRGRWTYERRLRLVPFEGGMVAAAKVYRNYAQDQGLLVTLKEKAKTVPQVDKLVGSVNLWYWKDAPTWTQDDRALAFGQELKARGVDRVLWSHEQDPRTVQGLNQLGFLTGRYDIYQDVWGPENPHSWVNRQGWPDDLVWDQDGQLLRGWVDRDGEKEYPGGVICSSRALVWERRRVPPDLKDHPYGARFIDTTTASPLHECWNPAHPLSRSQDKANKRELLDWLNRDQRLVVGSETGFDFAVPVVHYFEGMMSLGPFRLPDSGYDLTSPRLPSEDFLAFQVGPQFRIPLFELVYHDCVVSFWYWGDSSNRIPEVWDVRDLFNALYGTGPLWIVDPKIWTRFSTRFVESYHNATTVARRTGYSQMTDFQVLTSDRTVQRSMFADGTTVTANFGSSSWTGPRGLVVKPRSFVATFPDGTKLER